MVIKYNPAAEKTSAPYSAVALLRCSIDDARLKVSAAAVNASGTRAAAAAEDGVVRMWDVVWVAGEDAEAGGFDEAAMRDSVRAHHVHVRNGVSKKDNHMFICIQTRLIMVAPKLSCSCDFFYN